ncbi:Hsp20/alpha crystallin family protein [uncultured Mycolicibacterium sp.]|uniref:Hsp20/alpha crystallin family protein n=1 Tax=uncultured Mycolicibacterium sp. TaxID=2320817 RepID=UPI00260BA08D|nr:Hsp20/alpha crystallin family protein [uncultured Mycolicibacterium sp.]
MSNVTLWNPLDVALDMDRWMDRWMRDFFGPARDQVVDWPARGFTPAAEILRDGDDAVIRLELAGVDVDKDVNIELDKGRLVIHGERRDEHAEDKDGRTLREVRYGAFRRSFALPEHVTADAISANYTNGVLTVRVAGAYSGSQPQRIAIEAK